MPSKSCTMTAYMRYVTAEAPFAFVTIAVLVLAR